MSGPVAVVTGAGSGIGRATALRLASQGMRVVIAERARARGRATARAIAQAAGEARLVPTDVADPAQVRRLIAGTVRAFGRLDVLVNNAGIALDERPIEATSEREWTRVLATNLTGAYLCIRYAMPHLRRTGGAIVNVASTQGLHPQPESAAYAASKGGLIALTRAVALDAAPRVRVNCVCPGAVATPMTGEDDPVALHAENRAWADRAVPLRRFASPDEIAAVIAFLASSEAAYLTGAVVIADGGLTIE